MLFRYRGSEGMVAWAFHRISGIGIFAFVLLHVFDIFLAGANPNAYDDLLKFYASTPGRMMEVLIGAALLAMAQGPLVAFVCESLVLLVQGLFFGAGGITVLGVNALAMGLLGPLCAWLVFQSVRRISPRLAAFIGAYLGMQVSTLAVALTLGLQHHLSPAIFPTPLPVMIAAMMLPSLTLAGIVEGLYTMLALRLLERVRGKAAS